MIEYLKPANLIISVVMYLPFWWRIIKRGTSGDISLVFQGLLLVMQIINLVIAWDAGAQFFQVWYILQTVLVSGSIGLVVYYYD